MKTLKGLTFGLLPKITYDPVLARRAALIVRLEEQRALAQDPTYVPTVQRWVANEQGSKSLVAVQKRVRPWWLEDGNGKIALTVRYGSKPIEFEKGKSAILLPNKGALVSARYRHCSGASRGVKREPCTARQGAGNAEGKESDFVDRIARPVVGAYRTCF
jgi:hypothetical protein